MVAVDTRLGVDRGGAARLDARSWRDGLPGEAEWAALARQASEPNPFYEHWFLAPSLAAFDPQGEVLLVQLRVDDRLVGLAPVRKAQRYYGRPVPHLAFWLHENAFCGVPLIAPGFEAAFWTLLLDWADKHARFACFLHCPALPEASAPEAALGMVARQEARPAGMVSREARALLASDLAPEGYYAAALSSKKRKELRRQARRLAECGSVTLERSGTPDQIVRFAEEFIALEEASWKGRAGSSLASDPARAAFFREALVGAAAGARVEGLALRLDAAPVAMLATFLAPPGAFAFKTAFDERYARLSPGVLLQKENLALLAREDVAWCDSCAAPNHPMIDHFWREQRVLVARNVAIGGRARRTLGARLIVWESGRAARSPAT